MAEDAQNVGETLFPPNFSIVSPKKLATKNADSRDKTGTAAIAITFRMNLLCSTLMSCAALLSNSR